MHKIYEKKIEDFKKEECKQKKISRLYLYGKLLSFAAMVGFAYLSYNQLNALNISFILIFLVFYIVSYVLDDKCKNIIDTLKSMQTVCKNEINYLNGVFTEFDSGDKYINPQHEFSYDLDIFGPNSFFNRINRTITQKGSDRLAEKLTNLSTDTDKINSNQEAIVELNKLPDWRIKFIANNKIESNLELLSGYISPNKYKNILINSILPYISIALSLSSLVLGIMGILPFYFFLGMFSIQILITIFVSKISAKTSIQTDKLHKEYLGYLAILKDIHKVELKSKVLSGLKKELFESGTSSLDSFKQLSRILNLFDQRASAIMYIVLNGTILYDVILIKLFVKWGEKYLPHVNNWINCISEIDALVSLSNYAFNNPANTLATIMSEDSENIIQAKNVYHPFLSHKKAVPNDFILKRSNIAIVTGANMAGKSTFLRTIGMTYIMASNGIPVCAETFSFSIVSLFSSMRTTDDLSKDVSYFNAELIRLKQLIEYVKSHRFTFIILDEILKGTNSKDKLKGSIMFLNEISKYNISAIIATHDLELAKLEEKDSSTYLNYCFEIELSEEITYSYKIENGVAQNLNASYLLSNILSDAN
ncbi:MAG: DNA mismatch repair protein MutS [Mediterranea sp.]|jgi:DNA mismatch repair ATPase MutS|nr:DNA mismatch repair protein MutS [Mediterranea sp.]